MRLPEIQTTVADVDSVIVFNRSSKLFQMVLNQWARRWGIDPSARLRVDSVSDIVALRSQLSSPPFLSQSWLVWSEDLSGALSDEFWDVVRSTMQGDRPLVRFVLGFSSYRSYRMAGTPRLWGSRTLDTFMATYLTRGEFTSLLSAVSRNRRAGKLAPKLRDLMLSHYLGDPTACFEVLSALKSGVSFSTRDELVSLVGAGSLTVEQVLLSVFRSKASSRSGITALRSKVTRQLTDLCLARGFTSVGFAVRDTLVAFIECHALMEQGVLHPALPVDIDGLKPSVTLTRALRYRSTLQSIPLDVLYRALSVLPSDRWSGKNLLHLQFVSALIDAVILAS